MFTRVTATGQRQDHWARNFVKPKPRRDSRRERAARSSLEPLESRRLLTTMTVTGTAGPDTITLTVAGSLVTATVNGTPQVGSDVGITDVLINAQGGDDTILIHSNGANPVVINCGAGNDTVHLAPNSQDLDNIGGGIAINGDADHDTATLFDNNHALGLAYVFQNGNQMRRASGTVFTFNTLELAHLEGGSGNNFYSFTAMPTAPFSLRHNGGFGTIQLKGSGSEAIVYKPDATVTEKGVIDLGAQDLAFENVASIVCSDLSSVQLITPNPDDVVTIDQSSSINNRASGTSDGVAFTPLSWNTLDSFALDVGLGDIGADAFNQVTCTGSLVGSSQVTFNGGPTSATSSSLLIVNDGTWTVDLNTAASRRPWLVQASGNTTDVTFLPNETFRRIEINSDADVRLSGLGNSTVDLSAADGTGTIHTQSGGFLAVTNVFSIAAGATLVKEGSGTVSIEGTALQVHGAGALLDVETGTFNLRSNAGSPTSRNLSVVSDATLNFFTAQHLDGVFADIGGTINVAAAGDRTLVCTTAAVNGEGGQINLFNNDMIVDYAAGDPSPIDIVRLLLRGGYAGGAWNGIGIASSTAASGALAGKTALGYAEATDFFSTFPATFSGQPVDDTAILIKFTFYGDANFDGRTNLNDFNVLAANFGQTNRRWIAGDNDYNLTINLNDFNHLAAAFGGSGLDPAARPTSDPVRTIADEIFDQSQSE